MGKEQYVATPYTLDKSDIKSTKYIANLICYTSCLNASLNKKFGSRPNINSIKCPFCNSKDEDFNHFMFACSKYNEARNNMIQNIKLDIPYFQTLTFEDMIKRIFFSPSEIIKKALNTFILKAYEDRLNF